MCVFSAKHNDTVFSFSLSLAYSKDMSKSQFNLPRKFKLILLILCVFSAKHKDTVFSFNFSLAYSKDISESQFNLPRKFKLILLILFLLSQVSWDEPEVLQNVRSVSPWQVELVSATPQLQTPYPVMKKLRGAQSHDFFCDGGGNMLFPLTDLKSKSMGIRSPLINYHTFPVGMQGARHDLICVPTLSNFVPLNAHQMLSDSLNGINMPQKSNNVSNNLNVESKEGSSTTSHRSIVDCGTDLLNTVACNPTRKTSGGSFQLFGQIIQIEEPVDVDANKECRETTCGVLPHDFSISNQRKRLLYGLDVQCQRVSALESCFL